MEWNEFISKYFTWIEIIGYIASILVACTFYMKTILPLRILAICSNIAFIAYAGFMGLYPVLILHIFLFPLNIIRLIQIKKLIKKVREASRGNFSLNWLIPYMKKQTYKKGDVLFHKGDTANCLYFLQRGYVKIEEIDKVVEKGEIIGEIGIFSPFKERTSSAICNTDIEVYTIGEEKIIQLYYQNPSFGFYLIQLIIGRFVNNYIKGNDKIVKTKY